MLYVSANEVRDVTDCHLLLLEPIVVGDLDHIRAVLRSNGLQDRRHATQHATKGSTTIQKAKWEIRIHYIEEAVLRSFVLGELVEVFEKSILSNRFCTTPSVDEFKLCYTFVGFEVKFSSRVSCPE